MQFGFNLPNSGAVALPEIMARIAPLIPDFLEPAAQDRGVVHRFPPSDDHGSPASLTRSPQHQQRSECRSFAVSRNAHASWSGGITFARSHATSAGCPPGDPARWR
jgi:hypothetical protein